MSSAFVKEGEYQPLNTVDPELGALLFYLRRENSGISVSVVKSYQNTKHGQEAYEMSDGLTYMLNAQNQWSILLD